MISLWQLGCTFTAIFSYIFFNIQIKQSNDKTFTCLAAYIWCNILFLCSFFLVEIVKIGTVSAVFTKFESLATDNVLLSIASSIILLLMTLFLSYLLKNYNLSEVTLVLQLGIPLGTLGYYFLGNIPAIQQIIGIILVTIGSLISGFKKFEFPNIFKPLLTIPFSLFALGTLRCTINIMVNMIAFIVSQKTIETISIHHLINQFDETFPDLFISFENSLQFIISRAFSLSIIFLICLVYKENFSFKKIILKSKKDLFPIILGGIFIGSYTIFYYYVFQTIEYKSTLSALNQFQIPFTVIIASLILKERISLPKKVATALIVIGGLLAAL